MKSCTKCGTPGHNRTRCPQLTHREQIKIMRERRARKRMALESMTSTPTASESTDLISEEPTEPLVAVATLTRRVRPKSLNPKQMRSHDPVDDIDVSDYDRPRHRADCLPGGCNESRPCPWVSCSMHLYIDVSTDTGSIKLNRPDLDVWDMPETCALDIADRGGITLEQLGANLNLTRERIRQVESKAILKLKRSVPRKIER